MDPFDKRHRQDDKTVFMGLVGPVEGIGDVPDDGGFFLYVAADGGQAFFTVHIGYVADVGGWTKQRTIPYNNSNLSNLQLEVIKNHHDF